VGVPGSKRREARQSGWSAERLIEELDKVARERRASGATVGVGDGTVSRLRREQVAQGHRTRRQMVLGLPTLSEKGQGRCSVAVQHPEENRSYETRTRDVDDRVRLAPFL